MHIQNIQIKNFKTFDDLTVDLNKFNVVIGECGSGKTNFMEVFELLRDISQDFHEAIKKHGGEFVRNLNHAENDESCLRVSFVKNKDNPSIRLEGFKINSKSDYVLNFSEVDYKICFKFDDAICKVVNEMVKLKCSLSTDDDFSENMILLKNVDGDISCDFLYETELDINCIIPDALCDIVSQNFKKQNTPLINSPLSVMPIDWGGLFKNIRSYDFDPKLSKSIDSLNNNQRLTKYGENLPIVLKKILNDNDKRDDFLLFYTDMISYIKDVSVEKILDEERIFIITEKYNDVKIPAPFISDGTITIMAILIALYFHDGEIILIEEPERHVYPSMISKMMLMMESVRDRQIIITTHSAELLKYPELEDIFFISRDNGGFSQIDKVIDNDVVRPFIDELGIDSVFVNNYIGLQP